MAFAAAGAGRGTAGPVGVGVPKLLVYNRYLTTTEMLGALLRAVVCTARLHESEWFTSLTSNGMLEHTDCGRVGP
jgi:hypothetical protein